MKPLDQIGFGLRDHKAALWWLGLLYRRPKSLKLAGPVGRRQARRVAAALNLHALPYIFTLSALISAAIARFAFGAVRWLDLLTGTGVGIGLGIEVGMGLGIAVVIAAGIEAEIEGVFEGVFAIGIGLVLAGGIAGGIGVGITRGVAGGIAFGIGSGVAFGLVFVTAGGIALGTAIVIPVMIGYSIEFMIDGAIEDMIAVGITFGIGIGYATMAASGIRIGFEVAIVFEILYFRLFYLPAIVLSWPRPQGSLYRFHPVAWDDCCFVPFFRFDKLLLSYSAFDRQNALAEIDRLIATYPSQSAAALRTKSILIARDSATVYRLNDPPRILGALPGGNEAYLAQTLRIQALADEIAAEQNRLDTMLRPMFREETAKLILEKVRNAYHQFAGFQEPLRTEFRLAAKKWEALAEQQLLQIQRVVSQKPVHQVFRAGDPVDRNQEAFVLRTGVVEELEQQLMLSTGCPGIVLYGRRRMGKSTVLRNIDGFLPTTVRVLNMSMQDPALFSSVGSFATTLSQRIADTAPAHDLPSLMKFLDTQNARLRSEGRKLILALDEYEQIDIKIGEGVFSLDVLHTLRESIQVHRYIIWLLAGSHEVTELPKAPWASYLVSARTIDVPVFTREEHRMLLTEPVRYSTLWPKNSPNRPRFSESFWGPDGIERIYKETAGWPHLVQLVAESCIDVLNDQEAREVTPALFRQALDRAVSRGHLVLHQLLCGESTPAEWTYLEGFRNHESQPPPEDSVVRRALRRREIITESNGDWLLRVPLMSRWLIDRYR